MRRADAIVRCALDLGLRSGEVARLSLNDIDWRAGTITLRLTKGRREDVLPLPATTGERPMLGFLSRAEMVAVLGQPGATWSSQRDHLLLAMLYNTGARVSEIIGVRVVDVVLDGGACVHLHPSRLPGHF